MKKHKIELREQYAERLKNNKRALWVEIAVTLGIAAIVVMLSLSNIAGQARQYASDVQTDYQNLMNSYVRIFDVAYGQIVDKIEEDLSFEELDSWLKSKDTTFAEEMGSDIYDGISFTYKGDFARSWSYGDYSDYDATTRRWYQVAQAADGKTAIVAPYVTFLDAQFLADDSYILMSIVRKYNEEISFDYDIKIGEIKAMLQNRQQLYDGTGLMLYDADGYILSSSEEKLFAHNIYQTDGEVSQSLSDALTHAESDYDSLRLVWVEGAPHFLYTNQVENGYRICMMIPFVQVFQHDLLAIGLIVLFLIGFEIYLFRRNRSSLIEFNDRDERLTAVTHAAFLSRLYVSPDDMTFYGEKDAEQLFPDHDYEKLYAHLREYVTVENEKKVFDDFLSPAALKNAEDAPYHMQAKKFSVDWKRADGTRTAGTIEINRMFSLINGKRTAAILSRDVSEDAKILKTALRQAESASLAKGDFMAHMSHEIRTPLNAVIGYLDIAQSERQNEDKVTYCLEQSTTASRHLLRILNDVLDISAIENGRMQIAHEDFDLTQLLNSLTTAFYTQASEKDIHFSVSADDLTEEWVNGDRLRLNQILVNLLSNAVKFTHKDGTVQLSIRQVSIHNDKVHLQFQIADTGIGMSEAYKKRIFTPFEQENASIAMNYGGTGLGLSITYNLVRMMGGSISVESEQGKGSTFTVLLAFDRTEQKKAINLQTDSFSHLRALIVDDEDNACEYIQKLLERCGVKCDAVNKGKKAVRRVSSRMGTEHPYDFCIVDWNMPEMNGLETAKQIRDICGADMPIIIATGYDYSAIIEEAKQIGVNKIISKPLFQSSVFDMLVNTFGKYEPAPSKKTKKKQVDFAGMRVILAEDNEMNMEIATEILTKVGMLITPAYNGKEALELFTASEPNTYSAVLMDIQMPIMDGYEATRQIRKSSHPQAKTIPIIAMTANAFTSDVTASLAAGMNDHIAKPVSYERLFEALSKLTGTPEA